MSGTGGDTCRFGSRRWWRFASFGPRSNSTNQFRQSVAQTQGKGWKNGRLSVQDGRAETRRLAVADVRRRDRRRHRLEAEERDWMRIVAAAMVASTLAGLIANTSRLTTGRTRPREGPEISQGFYGPWNGRLTIGNPSYNSFPSGHTATAFGFAGVIFFARPWLGVGALGLASLIAWSSIMIGAHHFSDVVAAICLSLFISWYALRWTREHGEAFARRVLRQLKARTARHQAP